MIGIFWKFEFTSNYAYYLKEIIKIYKGNFYHIKN